MAAIVRSPPTITLRTVRSRHFLVQITHRPGRTAFFLNKYPIARDEQHFFLINVQSPGANSTFFLQMPNRPGRTAYIFKECPIARGETAFYFQNLLSLGGGGDTKNTALLITPFNYPVSRFKVPALQDSLFAVLFESLLCFRKRTSQL